MICNDWDLRLVDGTSDLGMLEFCLNSNWNTLVLTDWEDTSADVACKQLGFLGGSTLFVTL